MAVSIALLGGSFNPIHYGHLAMAEAAAQALSPEHLLIMPDGNPPHKSTELAGKWHRLAMTELASADAFEVSDMEVERSGKTYTVDTLEALHAENSDVDITMLIGADTLHELHTWKNAPRVFTLCRFAVFARDDLPFDPVEGATVIRLEADIPNISSTEIRERVRRGLSLEGYTPQAVENYIGEHRLYHPPRRLPKKEIRAKLKTMLPAKRYRHVLSVERTMRALAEHWSYDTRKASLTGLLHDCAKAMPLGEMQAYVDAMGLIVDDMRKTSTALLHAPASMAMARQVFGVTDPEILHAIRYHNTGSTDMGMLDKLLYLADMIEPNRPDHPWLTDLRALSMQDVDAAVKVALEQKLAYIKARKQDAHPDTAAALAAITKSLDQEGNA